MTRAEQEAFEKWAQETMGALWGMEDSLTLIRLQTAFIAGYRAGFEAQHYELTPSDGSHPMGFKGIHYEVDDD